jgi:hypothetical protein
MIMKLGEFQEKFRVRTRYSVDSRRWNAEHRECDVICYAVAGGDTGWRCWAVIYQVQGKYSLILMELILRLRMLGSLSRRLRSSLIYQRMQRKDCRSR